MRGHIIRNSSETVYGTVGFLISNSSMPNFTNYCNIVSADNRTWSRYVLGNYNEGDLNYDFTTFYND
jgi:hypothetical protein